MKTATRVGVLIPEPLYLEVVGLERVTGTHRSPTEVIEWCIRYGLDQLEWKSDDLSPEPSSNSRGYTWKHKDSNLFLPDGTEIRMRFKGAYYYAKVIGDAIQYQGQPITPGSLANSIGGMNRNAWRDLWIKRPKDEEWQQADSCRKAAQQFLGSFE